MSWSMAKKTNIVTELSAFEIYAFFPYLSFFPRSFLSFRICHPRDFVASRSILGSLVGGIDVSTKVWGREGGVGSPSLVQN